MNTRFHPLASLAFALSAALAGPAWAAGIDPAQEAVEIIATPAAKLAAEAVLAEPYGEYQYEMSNGRRLNVVKDGHTLIVQYGRRVPRQLQHDGHGRFVSNDGRFVLRFGLDDNGRPYAASLSLPAALA
jgi:hypothetical protein